MSIAYRRPMVVDVPHALPPDHDVKKTAKTVELAHPYFPEQAQCLLVPLIRDSEM